MQQVKFIQRNYRIEPESLLKPNIYITIPEQLKGFEDRVNFYLRDGWRVFSTNEEKINNASIMIFVLIRDLSD
jgi:hypothetical protein